MRSRTGQRFLRTNHDRRMIQAEAAGDTAAEVSRFQRTEGYSKLGSGYPGDNLLGREVVGSPAGTKSSVEE